MKRLLTTMLFLVSAAATFAQNPEAIIREITGTVELKKPGADWTAANPGDSIDRATIISTGLRSSALLALGNWTLLVRPVTRLSLEDILNLNETETISVNLQAGRIRVDVTPPTGHSTDFTVRAPTMTASVRGTSFEMDTTGIRVLEGTVSYIPLADLAFRPVKVRAGQESRVNPDTGNAVTPMAAEEAKRSPRALPGQNAGTLPDDRARLVVEVTGLINIELGGIVW